ncbi:MAG: outer membrane beta-barrel protein [Niabella sp.]
MNKILLAAFLLLLAGGLFAQKDSSASPGVSIVDTAQKQELVVSDGAKKPKKKYNLSNRANDHFMLQLGYTNWLNIPDSIGTKGFSRSINAYFMFDLPFKETPQLSAGLGLGIGSDHVFLDDDNFADVKASTSTLKFESSSSATIKKTKVVTTYLEAPIELRYTVDPEHSDKSFKTAVGVKVGTMLKGGTRSRITESGSQSNYLLKEYSKYFFNTTRVVGTARIGYGHFSLFGTYQFTSLLKTGMGPQLRPFTAGISLGGL